MQGIKFVPSKEQVEFIKASYNNSDLTQREIAEKLKINPYTLNRVAKSLGLKKVRKNVWTSSKISWLKENYNLTYSQMQAELGFLDKETIRLKINELGLKRTTRYKPFKVDMSDKEFLNDLKNPTLSAPDIVSKYKDKYGIGVSRIHQLRKKLRIKLQLDYIHHESTSEAKVREILESFDIAFVQEKRIGRYHIDFYLGFHVCLEVQGKYWHTKFSRVLRDIRKRKFLESKGYTVVYIWDDKIDKARGIIESTLRGMGLPI